MRRIPPAVRPVPARPPVIPVSQVLPAARGNKSRKGKVTLYAVVALGFAGVVGAGVWIHLTTPAVTSASTSAQVVASDDASSSRASTVSDRQPAASSSGLTSNTLLTPDTNSLLRSVPPGQTTLTAPVTVTGQ